MITMIRGAVLMVRGALRTLKHILVLGILAFCVGLGVYVARELTTEALLFASGLTVGVVVGSITTALTCRLARKPSPVAPAAPVVLPEGFVFLPGQAPVPGWPPEETTGV